MAKDPVLKIASYITCKLHAQAQFAATQSSFLFAVTGTRQAKHIHLCLTGSCVYGRLADGIDAREDDGFSASGEPSWKERSDSPMLLPGLRTRGL